MSLSVSSDPATNVAIGTLVLFADGTLDRRKMIRLARAAVDTIREGYATPVEPEDGLAGPSYRTPGERAVAHMRHAVAELAEAMYVVRPCCCPTEPCELCRVVNGLVTAMGDATEFLAVVVGPEDGGE